jgi:hypothetical protein
LICKLLQVAEPNDFKTKPVMILTRAVLVGLFICDNDRSFSGRLFLLRLNLVIFLYFGCPLQVGPFAHVFCSGTMSRLSLTGGGVLPVRGMSFFY